MSAMDIVVELGADQWEYSDGPLVLRIHEVRRDLSRYYDGQKVWLEGWRLDTAGVPIEWIQVLVPINVLPANIR